jgi:hypothetical protein
VIAKFCTAKASAKVMANYLLNERVIEHNALCIYGDKQVWLNKIKDFTAKHPYLSFVYAFSDKDSKTLTSEIEQEIINQFLDIYCPSIDPRYLNVLAVKHTDKGNNEIHILLENKRYDTNKVVRFSPSHKGEYLKKLQLMQKKINHQYGFEDPATINQQNTLIDKFKTLNSKSERIESINKAIELKVEANEIGSKDEVISYLESQNFTITRNGKNYISITLSDIQKPIRLKGEFYGDNSIKAMIRFRHNLKSKTNTSSYSANDEAEVNRITNKHSEKLQLAYANHQASLNALTNNKQTQFINDDKPIKNNKRTKPHGRINKTIEQLTKLAADYYQQSAVNRVARSAARRIAEAKSATAKLLERYFEQKKVIAKVIINSQQHSENIKQHGKNRLKSNK